ncbi:MAG: class I SAM-dependent methyltransferase family protein [Methanomassiliicoccaceae archaeon]|nr:class I SAM-dependent methyltransferase family protein [Methanomassiliicoccaceae archaeon]
MARCVRVPKQEGERARADLLSKGMLDTSRRIGSDGQFLLIPVLAEGCGGYEAADADLEPVERAPTDYRDVADVPEGVRGELPTSFDVVGDVAIIKLPDALLPYKRRIGEAMMSVSRSVRAVMLDSGVKGEMRVRDLEQIAGEGGPETVHREFGVRMAIDPSKVYFNPRLATERARVASLVRDGETVIDMFAGAAPFGLVICRMARPEVVYSIDINPEAEGFARRSMALNRIGNIVPITGDAPAAMEGLPPADRVIMNLPQTAESFLPAALMGAKDGGTVHLYKVAERSEFDGFMERMRYNARSLGFVISIEGVTELKTYSPTMSVYAIDIKRETRLTSSEDRA